MTATLAPRTDSLSAILTERGDPMAACLHALWLKTFLKIPDDAAPPLAMSGPHPRAVGSYGAECIAWAKKELGITLRWWQALAVVRQLEHDKDGALVWREIVESGPRRIGKSVRLRVVALWRIAHAERIGETQLAMLVSKDLAVGKEIHRGAWRWAEKKGWKVTRLNGGQEVETPDESRWLLRADTAVYGYDVGYGQVDESWGVDPQSITDGLEPALLERLWSQLHLTSTAHVKATSLMRRRMVAALRSADPDVLLLLWGAHPDDDIDDETTWRASSPHWSKDRRDLVARKYGAALAGQSEPEFDDPDPIRGWAAQYLNVWPGLLDSGGGLFGDRWSAAEVPSLPDHPTALSVAFDRGRTAASISAAGFLPDGRTVVGAVDRRPGTGWAQLEVARIALKHGIPVAVDEKGPAGDLIDPLRELGVTVVVAGTAQYIEACTAFDSKLEEGTLAQAATAILDDAVSVAGWRYIGDRRVFARKSGDIAALEAAALAAWAADDSSVYEERGLLTL